ncbi:MAG: hypothetical protein ACE15C_12165 [Phycisphaerae bacterium]
MGIPGSGIGGLYYILLALAMPFCELYLTVRGRGSWARWRAAGKQAGYAVGILAAMAGAGWLLHAAFVVAVKWMSGSPALAQARLQVINERLEKVAWSGMAWLSIITLTVVIILPTLLAMALSLRERLRAARARRNGAAGSLEQQPLSAANDDAAI